MENEFDTSTVVFSRMEEEAGKKDSVDPILRSSLLSLLRYFYLKIIQGTMINGTMEERKVI